MSHTNSFAWINPCLRQKKELAHQQEAITQQIATLERKMATLASQQRAWAQRTSKLKKKFPEFKEFPKSLAEEREQQNAISQARTDLQQRKQAICRDSTPISVAPFKGLRCYPVPSLSLQPTHVDSLTGLLEPPLVEFLVRSPVLVQPTIWQPCWEVNKIYIASPNNISDWGNDHMPIGSAPYPSSAQVLIAEWPEYQERKYEGDDRIRTSYDHRRFLPVPRKRTNTTVNFSLLPFLPQHDLDKVCQAPSHEQVLWNYYESGNEGLGDDQINIWLGESLKDMLIPDAWTIF
ncbi:hypothetical protein MBLNU459_g8120t1 [Dothideomycetes sp. NU459]